MNTEPGKGGWQAATLIEGHLVASNVMSLTFTLPEWQQFRSGQHFDIRLTAPGGYQAQRSYSLASAPEQVGVVEFGVQLLEDGEVSPYLWQMKPGAQVEMRGPIGGHFIWDVSIPGPLILIGGGSGVVPLMSMIRHHCAHLDEGSGANRAILLLISARTLDKVLYREELAELQKQNPKFTCVITLTDEQPIDWSGYSRRVDSPMLQELCGQYKKDMPMIYVCGPTKFVESVAGNLVTLGFNSHVIKTERFG